MNKYMHPRNIYKTPPDFKSLALEFPDFCKYLKQDITGKVTFNFKDVNALRTLSTILLKKDFGLDVDIPTNKLIPTIPLRLNYLLWIEDLLSIINSKENIYGIDIGTGASCVYPLIGAKKFGWYMIGTDIDEDSIIDARSNVARNSLDNQIQLLKVSGNTIFEEINIDNSEKIYDFCMCNPPFFSTPQELNPFFKSRKTSRPIPKNAFCASINEVVINGGEIEFISKIIEESVKFKNKIKIFTTMVGHKNSLPHLKSKLRNVDVTSFKQTEFCQGHTTRWGLAWTFFDTDLRKASSKLKNFKSKPPLLINIPLNDHQTIETIKNNLIIIWKNLQFSIDVKNTKKNTVIFLLTAIHNTWSNQRRQRREQMRLDKIKNEDNGNPKIIEETSDKLEEMNLTSCNASKRELDDDDNEYYKCKKIKSEPISNNNLLAELTVVLRKENESELVVEFFESNANTKVILIDAV